VASIKSGTVGQNLLAWRFIANGQLADIDFNEMLRMGWKWKCNGWHGITAICDDDVWQQTKADEEPVWDGRLGCGSKQTNHMAWSWHGHRAYGAHGCTVQWLLSGYQRENEDVRLLYNNQLVAAPQTSWRQCRDAARAQGQASDSGRGEKP
jgi:hypothetical protein